MASIAGFYSLYYEEPHGRYHIQVCNDLPCAMRGADEFLKQVCDYLGIEVGETTPDGLFTVEAVKCLAACHRAPMFQVQGDGDIVTTKTRPLKLTIAWIEEIRADRLKPARRRQRMSEQEYILLRHRSIPDIDRLDVYRQNGGFQAFKKPSPR